MAMMTSRLDKFVTRAAQKWLDRHARAPRGLGFSVDDGLPDRGERYGGAQTIHNTGTIDIQVDDAGKVVRVWFRCMTLKWRVTQQGTGTTLYAGDGEPIVAVEVLPE